MGSAAVEVAGLLDDAVVAVDEVCEVVFAVVARDHHPALRL